LEVHVGTVRSAAFAFRALRPSGPRGAAAAYIFAVHGAFRRGLADLKPFKGSGCA